MIRFFLLLHPQKVVQEEMAHLKLAALAVVAGIIYQMAVERLAKGMLEVQAQQPLVEAVAVLVLLVQILPPLVVAVLVVLA
jgi:hypothetical protein